MRPEQWGKKTHSLALLGASSRWVETRARLSPHKCSLRVTHANTVVLHNFPPSALLFFTGRGVSMPVAVCSLVSAVRSSWSQQNSVVFEPWPPASTKWLISHANSSTRHHFPGIFPGFDKKWWITHNNFHGQKSSIHPYSEKFLRRSVVGYCRVRVAYFNHTVEAGPRPQQPAFVSRQRRRQ